MPRTTPIRSNTFRREWGPEYYSFDVGQVHFVVLDNVRYPCNGVDDHEFCDPGRRPTYNGIIHQRQLTWLRNDLAHVPKENLLVISAHIPFVTYTDATAQKHQVDNLDELYAIVGDRPALGLSGHTHTTEQIVPGEHFHGWQENTGTGPAQFPPDRDRRGVGLLVGRRPGRRGNPARRPGGWAHRAGYYVLDFDGAGYVDTYVRVRRPHRRAVPRVVQHAAVPALGGGPVRLRRPARRALRGPRLRSPSTTWVT